MNPFGIVQLALTALEGVAYAVNPKLRRETKKSAVGFGVAYIGILIVGLVIVVVVVQSLYFQK
jgi:hypothetical protein